MPDPNKPTEPPVPAKPAALPVPTTLEGLQALLARTRKGDQGALPVVRKMLENPAAIDIFGGDLAKLVEDSFVNALGGADVGFKEAVRKKLELLRAELLGEQSTPVERLLVERVVACWLQVQDADARYAQGEKDATFRQSEHRQRRMDAAHRRYLAALKALALVRKLAVPALQINIASKQVNVVSPVTGAADGAASG